MKMLRKFFGNRLISKERWPLRSPDYCPYDYILWEYMKDRVFMDLPASIPELKVKIQEVIARVETLMMRRVFQNKFCCVNAYLEANGVQFEHLL